MDIQTLAAAIGIVKKSSGSAAERAETAAGQAEEAAALAQEYGYSLVFQNGYLVISEEPEEAEE